MLWDQLDPNGYMTPVGSTSGANTPFHTRSRNQSAENLNSTECPANSSTLGPGGLHNHLRSLSDPSSSFWPGNMHSNTNSPSPVGNDSVLGTSATHTCHPDQPSNAPYGANTRRRSSNTCNTNSLSWTSSAEASSPRAPEHIEMDVNELSKVPSYTTALRNNARTPLRDDLPTYMSATSSLPSMGMPHTLGQGPGGLQRRHSTENSTPSPTTLLGRAAQRSTLLTRFVEDDDQERRPRLLHAHSTTS